MDTSHQNGVAPDVFLKTASDAIRSDLPHDLPSCGSCFPERYFDEYIAVRAFVNNLNEDFWVLDQLEETFPEEVCNCREKWRLLLKSFNDLSHEMDPGEVQK